jgi:hypothetical protein
MPKFTIKDLLIATAMVSLGLGMVIGAHNLNLLRPISNHNIPIIIVLYFGGFSTIGTGIFYPFGEGTWLLGAFVGFLASCFLPTFIL